MSHYVDVIFSRPQYREKSWLERIAFHILFPLSWIALIMAMTDAAKEHFQTYGMPEALVFADEVWRRLTPYLHRDNVVSRLPIPQVSCQFPKLDVRSCRLRPLPDWRCVSRSCFWGGDCRYSCSCPTTVAV